jgi:hypothetical protein
VTERLSKEDRNKRKEKLKVLRRVALMFRPVKVKRVTDSARHTVGALPLRVDYRLNASAGDDSEGFIETLNTQRSRRSKATSGCSKKGIMSTILMRAGDVVVVKAAQGEGVLYFLVQLKQDVKEERSEEKLKAGAKKGPTGKGQKKQQETVVRGQTRVKVTPEKPLVR